MMKYLWDFKKHFYVMFSLRVEFGILKSVFPQASQQVSQSIVEQDWRPNTALQHANEPQ